MKRRAFSLAVTVFCSALLAAISLLRPSLGEAQVTILATFNGTNGANPFTENLVQARDGDLYGTTLYGGASNDGTVFKVTPSGTLTTIHSFSGTDGSNPYSGVVVGLDGDLYGTTYQGGVYGFGTFFKIILTTGEFVSLHSFDETDGGFPACALVQGPDKNFYGTASYSMPTVYGTVFKVTPTGTVTTLAFFDDTNGYDPLAGLALGLNENYYGTTATGGLNDLGTVFEITPAGKLTSLVSFDNTNGWEPESQLIAATDGHFYGTTLRGGANGDGEVFKISTTGVLTVVHSFDITDGYEPNDGLLQATDGNFYGTTTGGGTDGYGTVFQMNLAGTLSTLYSFTGGLTDGMEPFGGITQYTNGSFIGTTMSGGSGRLGTVFSFSEGLKPFVKLVPFFGSVGSSVAILGNGLTPSAITEITFGGVKATSYEAFGTYIIVGVPTGAKTGAVQVTTTSGMLTSNSRFYVIN